jgi:hypothetical protein
VSSIRGNSFKDMDIVCYEGRYRRSFHPTAGDGAESVCVSVGVFFLGCGCWAFDPGGERELRERGRGNGEASGQAFQSNLGGDVTSCKQVFGKAKGGVDEVNVKNQEAASREPFFYKGFRTF